jgi:hypothetical protein
MNDPLVIALEGPSSSQVTASNDDPAYDPQTDDVRSILRDLCSALAEDARVSFVVEVAGDRWPVDVRTDLLTVLDQAPGIHGTSFDIDFYEQGLERLLHFELTNGDFAVSCESHDPAWRAPDAIKVPREAITFMVTCLVNRFVAMATAARPNIVRHPWFHEWYQRSVTR